jgi:hypothetical protein
MPGQPSPMGWLLRGKKTRPCPGRTWAQHGYGNGNWGATPPHTIYIRAALPLPFRHARPNPHPSIHRQNPGQDETRERDASAALDPVARNHHHTPRPPRSLFFLRWPAQSESRQASKSAVAKQGCGESEARRWVFYSKHSLSRPGGKRRLFIIEAVFKAVVGG